MASAQEESQSNSSYDHVIPRSESTEEVDSVVCSDDISDYRSDAVSGEVKVTSETETKAWTRDDTFFFSLVTFRVEDQLFRVPREAFEKQSEFFRNMFAAKLEDANQGTQTGNNDEAPLCLEGIEKGGFRDFLRMLYPPSRTPFFPNPLLTREQWTRILHLAHTWGFKDIRSLAILELRSVELDEVERVELALKYGIEEWYAEAYLALAKRTQPLTVEEGKRLGLYIALKMAQVRERRLARMMEAQPTEPTPATQPAAGFAGYGGSYAPFGTSPTTNPQPSTVPFSSSSFRSALKTASPGGTSQPSRKTFAPHSSSSMFGKPAASGLQDPAGSSGGPSPLFGKTAFGFPTSATGQPETSTTDSNSSAFNFGVGVKCPSCQAEKGSGVKRLNIDTDDAQLKKDIKEVFGL